MSHKLGRLFRFSIRLIHVAALVAVVAVTAYTARAYFSERDTRERLDRARQSLDYDATRFAARRPLRQPLGPPIRGNAADDYDALCAEVPHRHDGFRLPKSAAELAELTPSQRAELESPRQLAAIDRFVRAARREDVRFGPLDFGCWMTMVRRPMAVRAAALAAADRGDLERAWERAVALVAYASDTPGRADMLRTVIATGQGSRAVELLADLAADARPKQARSWIADIDRLRASRLEAPDIPVAVVASAGRDFDLEPLDHEWLAVWARQAEDLVDLAGLDDPAAECREHVDESYCSMLETIIAEQAAVDAGLSVIADTLEIHRGKDRPSRL